MKVAYLSEAEADEAFIRVIVESVLGEGTERVRPPLRRKPGWPGVLNSLAPVIRGLHFQTDADALIIVADSDNSELHARGEAIRAGVRRGCRLCALRQAVVSVLSDTPARPHQASLRIGIGIAVPAIEAWYQFGRDRRSTEADWVLLRQGHEFQNRRRELKAAVTLAHGSASGTIPQRAADDGKRVARALADFERSFPAGFGPLADDLRSWRSGSQAGHWMLRWNQ